MGRCRSIWGRRLRSLHGLDCFAIDGVEIPQLTIAIWPKKITFDYQIGPDWGPEQLAALFEFLKRIKQKAAKARLIHAVETGTWVSETFEDVFVEYVRNTS